MPLFDPDDPRPVHFMGIAGAGMSALALVARRRGIAVTGCDLDLSDAADAVDAGARVMEGHDPDHLEGVRALIHTAAVPPDHPEIAAAAQAGIPTVKRAGALGELIAGKIVVGVAGTHGKTTTTTMATEALRAAGGRPSGIVGGRVEAWGGNARLDGDDLFVVEADEYDQSFLAMHPTVAIVNNVEADHLECYGDYQALEDAFVEYANRAQTVLLGVDDFGAAALQGRLSANVLTIGEQSNADVRISAIQRDENGSTWTLVLGGAQEVTVRLPVPGLHNIRNASMAVAAAWVLKLDPVAAAEGLRAFGGVGRRFEHLVTAAGISVVDDYAHHPSEVGATLDAARQHFPGRRLVAVFQPHLFSRTAAHGDALGHALAAADRVFVTDVYPAREDPIPGINGEVVVQAAKAAGGAVTWVPELMDVAGVVTADLLPGDAVIVLGAGTITRAAREIAERVGKLAA